MNVGYVRSADINKELFAEVLKESEAEIDRIGLERSVTEINSETVPGHARRGITKE
jgi:hypothetical protein